MNHDTDFLTVNYLKWLLKIIVVLSVGITSVNGGTKVLNPSSENAQINKLIEKADGYFHRQQYINPKGKNAYEIYQEVLKLDSANQDALKGIHDILNALLDLLKNEVKEYGELLKAETEGKDVKVDIILTLTRMIDILEDGKRICEEFPQKDRQIEQMIYMFKDNIEKYDKLRSFYQKKS